VEQHQREHRSDPCRRQRRENGERVDEALVEHAEDDVDRDPDRPPEDARVYWVGAGTRDRLRAAVGPQLARASVLATSRGFTRPVTRRVQGIVPKIPHSGALLPAGGRYGAVIHEYLAHALLWRPPDGDPMGRCSPVPLAGTIG
jgi:hypothetical protein